MCQAAERPGCGGKVSTSRWPRRFVARAYLQNAGLLAVDEVYSAEQVVIDYEIVQYVKRVCEGFAFDDAALALMRSKKQDRAETFWGMRPRSTSTARPPGSALYPYHVAAVAK